MTTVFIVSSRGEDTTSTSMVEQIANNNGPWTRWWWHGSAVTHEGITAQLEAMKDAGFGGVEITPIYGVQDNQDKNIAYLSPEWMEMYEHAISEARRLGMDVDMATGTGWPFGGPQVGPDTAAKKMWSKVVVVNEDQNTTETFNDGALEALIAYGPDAQIIDLTKNVDSKGRLDWTSPQGQWTLYAVFAGGTGQMVKRAAPGGEGLVLDYFSRDALEQYLKRFDAAFEESGAPWPHAFFNDSFEAYGANWTSGFFQKFKIRRGYELRERLPALFGNADPDTNARVRQDYNETMGDLLLEEFTVPWTEWAHSHGALTRNQAHGSPGNLLDLYAAADIPETEIFGSSEFSIPGLRSKRNAKGHPDPLVMKFSSSASNLTGKKTTSSETFTWLDEHFNVALSQMKPEADQLAVAGINQFVYHGTAYSPPDAAWPGWLFYASTHFQPTNPVWRDLPGLNRKVTVAQSLREMQPFNDILLYWPIHDLWYNRSDSGLLLDLFSVHNANDWLHESATGHTAQWLWDNGYSFDYVSDRLLIDVDFDKGALRSSGNDWQVLLVPRCRFMPAATLEHLTELARRGAAVLFQDALPEDVPGLGSLNARRYRFRETMKEWGDSRHCPEAIACYSIGNGEIRVIDLPQYMPYAPVLREPMADHGLTFTRKRGNGPGKGKAAASYYVANHGADHVKDWIPFAPEYSSAIIMTESGKMKVGRAAVKKTPKDTYTYLDIPAGSSLIVSLYDSAIQDLPGLWPYAEPSGKTLEITGTWGVNFIDGGPVLPDFYQTDRLVSWTKQSGKARAFGGTARYTIGFELPEKLADAWLLDLGDVRQSARVYINGRSMGLLAFLPFQMLIDAEKLRAGNNTLEIEVSNLAANRIRWMDRKKRPWKIFEDANIVDINYMPMNAAIWPIKPSGLLGPVTLTPMKYIRPE